MSGSASIQPVLPGCVVCMMLSEMFAVWGTDWYSKYRRRVGMDIKEGTGMYKHSDHLEDGGPDLETLYQATLGDLQKIERL